MSGPPYIVWSPDGPTPPKVSHPDHKSACVAMWRLARRHPGQQFYVMARTGKGAMRGTASHPDNMAEIHRLLAAIEAKRAAMDPEHRAALEAAELAAQRESWIRSGDYDEETRALLLDALPAQGMSAGTAMTEGHGAKPASPVGEADAP